MNVLVTGGSGLLGQALQAAAEERGVSLWAPSHSTLDVTNPEQIEQAICHRSKTPDLVINCAAFTDVEAAELNNRLPWKTNVDGARNVAEVCAHAEGGAGIPLIYVSTDYVFNGHKHHLKPYVESDLPNPLSDYGLSKIGGELATAAACRRHFIVRTAALYGPGGDNFVSTILSKAEKAEISVVSDQTVSPTYAPDLAHALLNFQSGAERPAYGLHHLAGSEGCTWAELAAEVLAAVGSENQVTPISSKDLLQVAERPRYSALATEKAPPSALRGYREGVRAYLREIGAIS